MKSKTGCAAAATGAMAVSAEYTCVTAVGCTDTDDANCKCTIHTGCEVTESAGDYSCLKVAQVADCPAPAPAPGPSASGASKCNMGLLFLVLVFVLMPCAGAQNSTCGSSPTSFQWDTNHKCTG